MRRSKRTFVICLGLVPMALGAQVTDMLPADGPFALEWHKPFFDDEGEFSFQTSTLMARALIPVADGVLLSGDLGFSYASVDGESSSASSNPEIGLVFVDSEEIPKGRVSVMLPFSFESGDDDFAVGTGILTFPNRVDRFIPDTWSINGMFTPSWRTPNRLVGLKAGASVIGPDQGDTELFARYGAFITGDSGGARFGAELSGEILVTESDASFSERSLHQITLSAGPKTPGVVPQVFVRLPLDGDLNDFLNAVVGVRVTF